MTFFFFFFATREFYSVTEKTEIYWKLQNVIGSGLQIIMLSKISRMQTVTSCEHMSALSLSQREGEIGLPGVCGLACLVCTKL